MFSSSVFLFLFYAQRDRQTDTETETQRQREREREREKETTAIHWLDTCGWRNKHVLLCTWPLLVHRPSNPPPPPQLPPPPPPTHTRFPSPPPGPECLGRKCQRDVGWVGVERGSVTVCSLVCPHPCSAAFYRHRRPSLSCSIRAPPPSSSATTTTAALFRATGGRRKLCVCATATSLDCQGPARFA